MAPKLDVDKLLSEFPSRFTPKPFYSPEGDCVEWYFEDADSHAQRIDCWLTVARAQDNDRLVGFKLKNIRSLLKAFEKLGLEVRVSNDAWRIDIKATVGFSPLVQDARPTAYRDVLVRMPSGETVEIPQSA